jgi:hypothetical protein
MKIQDLTLVAAGRVSAPPTGLILLAT